MLQYNAWQPKQWLLFFRHGRYSYSGIRALRPGLAYKLVWYNWLLTNQALYVLAWLVRWWNKVKVHAIKEVMMKVSFTCKNSYKHQKWADINTILCLIDVIWCFLCPPPFPNQIYFLLAPPPKKKKKKKEIVTEENGCPPHKLQNVPLEKFAAVKGQVFTLNMELILLLNGGKKLYLPSPH